MRPGFPVMKKMRLYDVDALSQLGANEILEGMITDKYAMKSTIKTGAKLDGTRAFRKGWAEIQVRPLFPPRFFGVIGGERGNSKIEEDTRIKLNRNANEDLHKRKET